MSDLFSIRHGYGMLRQLPIEFIPTCIFVSYADNVMGKSGQQPITKLVLLPGVGFSAVKIQIIAINEEGWVEFKVGNITTQLRGRIPCKPYILMFATPPAGK